MSTASVGSRRRSERVDAVRFFSMALVVLTHLLNLRWEFKDLAPWLVESMLAFNMPLFAFVSGYVLSGRESDKPLRFIRGKAIALLVPYLAWVAVEMPLRNLRPDQWGGRLLEAAMDPRAGFQMWFLWVLFVLFVVFVFVRSVSRSSSVLAASAIVAMLASILSGVVSTGADKVLWLYPFFVAGFFVAERGWMSPVSPTVLASTGAAMFIGVRILDIGGGIAAFATAAVGVVAVWGLYHALPERALTWQAWAGRRTMGLYGGQMVVLPFFVIGSGWSGAMLSWAAVIAVALGLTLVLERFSITRTIFLGSGPLRHKAH